MTDKKALVPVQHGVVSIVQNLINITEKILQWNQKAFNASEVKPNEIFSDSNTTLSQAKKRIQQKIIDYDKAIALSPKYYKDILLYPEDPLLYYNRGIAHFEIGNFKQAIADFDRAIEIDPKYADAYNKRGNVYCRLSKCKQAMKDCNKAIKLNPKEAVFYKGRGSIYFLLGKYNQAIKDYDKAIELEPQEACHYVSRVMIHLFFHNYKKAIADFDKLIERDPKNAWAYYSRWNACRLGDYKQDTEDLKKSARLGYKPAKDYLTKQGIVW